MAVIGMLANVTNAVMSSTEVPPRQSQRDEDGLTASPGHLRFDLVWYTNLCINPVSIHYLSWDYLIPRFFYTSDSDFGPRCCILFSISHPLAFHSMWQDSFLLGSSTLQTCMILQTLTSMQGQPRRHFSPTCPLFTMVRVTNTDHSPCSERVEDKHWLRTLSERRGCRQRQLSK